MRCSIKLIHRGNWWDFIDENVALGAVPMPWHVPLLRDLGVRYAKNYLVIDDDFKRTEESSTCVQSTKDTQKSTS